MRILTEGAALASRPLTHVSAWTGSVSWFRELMAASAWLNEVEQELSSVAYWAALSKREQREWGGCRGKGERCGPSLSGWRKRAACCTGLWLFVVYDAEGWGC